MNASLEGCEKWKQRFSYADRIALYSSKVSLQPPTSLQKGYGYSSYNCGHMITKVGQLEACLILAKAGEA